MFDTRFERIATGAGHLFFLAAIILFITLILLTTGTLKAQDSLEPDAPKEDALDQSVLENNAPVIERVDPAVILPEADFTGGLPMAEIPPPTVTGRCPGPGNGPRHRSWP